MMIWNNIKARIIGIGLGKSKSKETFLSSFPYSPTWQDYSGDVSNRTLYDLYIRDGIIRANIDFLTSSLSDIKVYEKDDGGELKEFDYNLNLENITKELVIYGYSIQYNNTKERRLESIRMSDIVEFIYDKDNKIEGFRLGVQPIKFKDYPNLILINSTTFNDSLTNKNSLLYPLVCTNLVTIKGKQYSYRLIDLTRSIEYATLANMYKIINTRHFITLKDNANLNELKTKLEDPNTLVSDIIFSNFIEDIKSVDHKVDNIGDILEIVLKIKNVITQNVFSLMLTTPSFTYASSQVIKELVEERVEQLKAQINKSLNEVFNKNFIFIENKEYTLDEILKLVDKGVLDRDEARKMLGLT